MLGIVSMSCYTAVNPEHPSGIVSQGDIISIEDNTVSVKVRGYGNGWTGSITVTVTVVGY